MTKFTAWTMSDLSRLIRPPPPCSLAAACVLSGPAASAALTTRAARARTHRRPPSRTRPRRCMRRSPRCDERIAPRTAVVKTITRRECRQPKPASSCDHPATDDEIALVPHDGLPGRDRPLRTIEDDLGPVGIDGAHAREACSVPGVLRAAAHAGPAGARAPPFFRDTPEGRAPPRRRGGRKGREKPALPLPPAVAPPQAIAASHIVTSHPRVVTGRH